MITIIRAAVAADGSGARATGSRTAVVDVVDDDVVVVLVELLVVAFGREELVVEDVLVDVDELLDVELLVLDELLLEEVEAMVDVLLDVELVVLVVVRGGRVVVVDEDVVVGGGRVVVVVVTAAGRGGAGESSASAIVTVLPRTVTVDGAGPRTSSTTRRMVGVNCPVRTRSNAPSPAASSTRGARRPSTAPSKSRTMRSDVAPSAARGYAVGRPGGPEKRRRTTGAEPPATSTCSRAAGTASAGMALSSTSTPAHRMFRSYAKRLRLSSERRT
jgi:hypothetical protein